jgi:hypothetical protein
VRNYLPDVVPTFKCGCEAVVFPESRIYRPELLTCDEILAEMDDFPVRLANYRTFLNRVLSAPFRFRVPNVETLPGEEGAIPVAEWIDSNDAVNVYVEWYLMFDGALSGFSVRCRGCIEVSNRTRARYNLPLVTPVASKHFSMTLLLDSDGEILIDVEHLPKHYIATHDNSRTAVEFAIKPSTVSGCNKHECCLFCKKPIVRVESCTAPSVVFSRVRTEEEIVGIMIPLPYSNTSV